MNGGCRLSEVVEVSIHSPRRSEGRLRYRNRRRRQSEGFNPLPPPKRGETTASLPKSRSTRFNPLPPPKRGETAEPAYAYFICAGFNPLPPPKRGETDRFCRDATDVQFQSTPPAEARGDWPGTSERARRCACFNPLPPPKRGETVFPVAQPFEQEGFNPLPPPKRGETRQPRGSVNSISRFQSTPPAEARGDVGTNLSFRTATVGFNPLPPPKRGETFAVRNISRLLVVAIHSPRRSEGRLARRESPARSKFQSTPPAEARGDLKWTLNRWCGGLFQSTPPAEARGDVHFAGSP